MFLSNTEECNKCSDAVASLESLAERQLGDVIWAKVCALVLVFMITNFKLCFRSPMSSRGATTLSLDSLRATRPIRCR
jgi:hypothetical protein